VENAFFDSLEKDSNLKVLTWTGKSGHQVFYEQLKGAIMKEKIQLLNQWLIGIRTVFLSHTSWPFTDE
jgi:hypothetical protein